jgi:hypothetical protein
MAALISPLISCLEYEESTKEQWHNVRTAAELADAFTSMLKPSVR